MTVSEAHPAGPDWKGLHPASLAVNLLPTAWRTIRGSWPLFVALIVGQGGFQNIADLTLLGIFTTLTLTRTLAHFATLRYRMNQGRLEIKSGLLTRQARIIDPARVQNIELAQNLFHRWSGLVELRIETAGDSNTEGLLSALSVEEAEELKAALRKGRGAAPASPEAPEGEEQVAWQGRWVEALAYGLTQRSVGVIAVLLAVVMEVLARMGPQGPRELAQAINPGTLVGAVLVAFAASWAWSSGTSLLRWYNFRLVDLGDRLATEAGLFTRRRMEMHLDKVQMLRIEEPFLRRSMGYGTVLIETAGFGGGEAGGLAEGVLPMVERGSLAWICRRILPSLDLDPWEQPLQPAHPRALRRALIGALLDGLLAAAVAAAIFGPWGLAAVALALPAGLVAALDWRGQAWSVGPEVIIARHGFLMRRTFILDRRKLQSVHIEEGPLMRLNGLGTVALRVPGAEIDLPPLGMEEARRIYAELRAGLAQPRG